MHLVKFANDFLSMISKQQHDYAPDHIMQIVEIILSLKAKLKPVVVKAVYEAFRSIVQHRASALNFAAGCLTNYLATSIRSNDLSHQNIYAFLDLLFDVNAAATSACIARVVVVDHLLLSFAVKSFSKIIMTKIMKHCTGIKLDVFSVQVLNDAAAIALQHGHE